MTLTELLLIKRKLQHVPGCFTEEQRRSCSSCMETKMALDIVEREIKLKTMDPRKEA